MQRRGVLMVAAMLASVWLLGACGSGMVRRVSDPAASLQQLTVNTDGSWSLQLRLQNYSSIAMRFDSVTLAMKIGGQKAGTVQATPQLSIGPESADVVTVAFAPTSEARVAVADALVSRRGIAYSLEGSIAAVPEEAKTRTFTLTSRNTLSPVPGLDGVLR